MTGNVTAAQAAKLTAKAKASVAKGNNTKAADDTEGSALFEYHDEETGLTQKFAFNLRYYLGASSLKVNKEKAKTAKEQKLSQQKKGAAKNTTIEAYANNTKNAEKNEGRQDGIFEFSPEATKRGE